MPTTPQNTFSNQVLAPMYAPEEAKAFHVKLPNSGTYARGLVLGEITASPGSFKAYASGNVDGSQNPKAVLCYDVTVDASGNHSIAGDQGATSPSTPAYFEGYFRTSELTGLDATALTNSPSWKIINGSTTLGTLHIG